jgi:hypothetical protein
MGAMRGEPGGRSPLLGTLKDVKRTALETDISLYRDHIGEPGGEASLPGTSGDSKREIRKRSLSLYGGCSRETWREASFTRNPEG